MDAPRQDKQDLVVQCELGPRPAKSRELATLPAALGRLGGWGRGDGRKARKPRAASFL